MALIIPSLTTDLGITATDAYARINNYTGDKSSIQVHISIYVNQAAYAKGAKHIRVEAYYIPVSELQPDTSILTASYSWLKANVPLFSNANDDFTEIIPPTN